MRIDGAKIRYHRTHLCLTQQDLADEAELSRRTVQKAEASDPDVSLSAIEKIACALNVDRNGLMTTNDVDDQADAFLEWQWRLPVFVRRRIVPIRRAYCRNLEEADQAIQRMRCSWTRHLEHESSNNPQFHRTDGQLNEELAAYRQRYLDIWATNHTTLMYATTSNQRSGVAVVLPITGSAFQRLRQGEISFMDITAQDVLPQSSCLVVDSAVELEHDRRSQSWFQITDSLSFVLFYQIAMLSEPINQRFTMASFVASRTNLGRLHSMGFTVTDVTMPKYGLQLCEFPAEPAPGVPVWDEREEKVANTNHFAGRLRAWLTSPQSAETKRRKFKRLLRLYQRLVGHTGLLTTSAA